MDTSALTKVTCPDCGGVPKSDNVLMLPEYPGSPNLVPKREILPCLRCDNNGWIVVPSAESANEGH